ncbi:hypothetical protein SGRIM128S_04815 [Streptomyces griseomycini]
MGVVPGHAGAGEGGGDGGDGGDDLDLLGFSVMSAGVAAVPTPSLRVISPLAASSLQGPALVDGVVGDGDRRAVLQPVGLLDLVGVQAERLQVDVDDGHDVGAVLLVEVVEVRLGLEVVGADRAVLRRRVRGDVVGELLHLEVEAGLLGQLVLDEGEDLGVRDGARGDDQRAGGVGGGVLLRAAGREPEGEGSGGEDGGGDLGSVTHEKCLSLGGAAPYRVERGVLVGGVTRPCRRRPPRAPRPSGAAASGRGRSARRGGAGRGRRSRRRTG